MLDKFLGKLYKASHGVITKNKKGSHDVKPF
jgi:hypothetical protein